MPCLCLYRTGTVARLSLQDWHSAMSVITGLAVPRPSLQDWHSIKAVFTGLAQCQDCLYRPGTVPCLCHNRTGSAKTVFTGLAQCQGCLYRTGTVPCQCPYRTDSVKTVFTGLAQCHVSVLTELAVSRLSLQDWQIVMSVSLQEVAQCQDRLYRTGISPVSSWACLHS